MSYLGHETEKCEAVLCPEAAELRHGEGGVDEAHLDEGLGQPQHEGAAPRLLLLVRGGQLLHQRHDDQGAPVPRLGRAGIHGQGHRGFREVIKSKLKILCKTRNIEITIKV